MNNRRALFWKFLVVALLTSSICVASSQTTTIKDLPTNPNPSSTAWSIVDDAVSNTWRSTLSAIVTSVVGPLPIGIGYGGTGLSSFSANQILGTTSGGLIAQFPVPLAVAQGGTSLSSLSASILLGTNSSALVAQYALPLTKANGGTGTSAPAPVVTTTAGAPAYSGSWPSQTLSIPVPYPTPTVTSANSNCTTSGLVITCNGGGTTEQVNAVATAVAVATATPVQIIAAQTLSLGTSSGTNWRVVAEGRATCGISSASAAQMILALTGTTTGTSAIRDYVNGVGSASSGIFTNAVAEAQYGNYLASASNSFSGSVKYEATYANSATVTLALFGYNATGQACSGTLSIKGFPQ